jgi:predicted dehydrogenase
MTDHPLRPPIGVALLGFGFAGEIFHAPFIATTAGLALRVIASRQVARVQAAHPGVRVAASPLDAIAADDVSLVVVATPNETHAPLAEAALRAGKHVVVDKPFTLDLAEARRLAAVEAETGRRLAVFQNRRWDSDFQGVWRAIAAGAIGDVVEFYSGIARWRPEVRDRWRERPGPGAGLWYDLGPHLIDQALVLFGLPAAVHGLLRVQRPGGLTDDWFHVTLDYPARQVILTSSMLSADRPARFTVRGTSASLTKQAMDTQEGRLKQGERPPAADWGHDPDPVRIWRDGVESQAEPAPAGDYGAFYAAMRDAITGGGDVPVNVAHATDVMAVLLAGIRSSDERRAVTIDEMLDG